MTAKKNFKRLVRARARKTGESYAAALRNFLKKLPGGPPVTSSTQGASPHQSLRRIERPEYGFAVLLPEDWREEPPDLVNSEWEVARFTAAQEQVRSCIVFRNPEPPEAALADLARKLEVNLSRNGYGNFRHCPTRVAGLPAVRIDFDRTTPDGRLWSV